MSDDQIRALERKYRASRDPKDGDDWVQAVLRTTGTPTTAMIGLVIQSQRAVRALAASRSSDGYVMRGSVQSALAAPVTPDDIVDFLRGGNNWLEPGMAASAAVGAASIEAEVDAQIMADIIREADTGLVSTAHSMRQLEQHARAIGVPAGSAILCNHANENPGHCPCNPDCYCRQDGHTCSDVSQEPNPFDRDCDLCDRTADYRFKHTTVLPNGTPNGYRVEVVCRGCLPRARERRTEFNLAFMNRRAAEQSAQATQDSINTARRMENVLWHGDGCNTNMEGGMICPKCGIPPSMQDTFLAPPDWKPTVRTT